jgi:hypothetical protein
MAKRAPARGFDIRTALNGNVLDEEAPAAQFKLNYKTWNMSIQQPS